MEPFGNEGPVGVLATRGNHISLFFVRSDLHGKGVGRRLFDFMRSHSGMERITVNSSPFAGIFTRIWVCLRRR
jgi:GNAT superfamily N-acetyltransferase